MEITIEQLIAIHLPSNASRRTLAMLTDTKEYIYRNGGKAWVHLHVLRDLGFDV